MGRPTSVCVQCPAFGIYPYGRNRGGYSCRREKFYSNWAVQFPAIRDRENRSRPVSSKILITEEGATQFSSGSFASFIFNRTSTCTRHAPA